MLFKLHLKRYQCLWVQQANFSSPTAHGWKGKLSRVLFSQVQSATLPLDDAIFYTLDLKRNGPMCLFIFFVKVRWEHYSHVKVYKVGAQCWELSIRLHIATATTKSFLHFCLCIEWQMWFVLVSSFKGVCMLIFKPLKGPNLLLVS